MTFVADEFGPFSVFRFEEISLCRPEADSFVVYPHRLLAAVGARARAAVASSVVALLCRAVGSRIAQQFSRSATHLRRAYIRGSQPVL